MFKFWPFNTNKKTASTTRRTFKLSEFLSYMQTKGWYKVTASLAMQLYEKNSALADSIDTIKDGAKTILPLIKRGDEYIDKHDLLDLLKNPNQMMSYSEFIESAIIYKLLTGNVFITALGNTSFVPLELYITPTDAIVINGEGLNYKAAVYAQPALLYLNKEYVNDPKTGRLLSKQQAELFHIKSFMNNTTTNGYVSNSILNSILYELEILNSGNNHNLSMLLNGVNLSGVFSIDTEDQKVVDQFIQDARSYFAGSSNAGKFIASKGKGIEFKPVQMTNKDMEALGNSEAVRKVIYDRYQIPSPLRSLGTETYSNYEAAQYVLYDKAILPAMDDLFIGLTSYFRKRKVLKPNEEIAYNPKDIPVIRKRYIEEIKAKKDLGIYTTNQLREMMGDDPLGPEHDVIYHAGKFVPVGTIVENQPQDKDDDDDKDDAAKRFALVLKKAGFNDQEITERVKKYYANNLE